MFYCKNTACKYYNRGMEEHCGAPSDHDENDCNSCKPNQPHIPERMLQDILDVWGESSQITMMIEECSELIKELCKIQRKQGSISAVLEEMADVENMLCQLKYILRDHEEEYDGIIQMKLERTQKLLCKDRG